MECLNWGRLLIKHRIFNFQYLLGLVLTFFFFFILFLCRFIFVRIPEWPPNEFGDSDEFMDLVKDVEQFPHSIYKYSHPLENTCKFPVIDKGLISLLIPTYQFV
jgi:hypothetical protein